MFQLFSLTHFWPSKKMKMETKPDKSNKCQNKWTNMFYPRYTQTNSLLKHFMSVSLCQIWYVVELNVQAIGTAGKCRVEVLKWTWIVTHGKAPLLRNFTDGMKQILCIITWNFNIRSIRLHFIKQVDQQQKCNLRAN